MPVIKRAKNVEPEEKVLDVNASMQGTMVFKDPVNLRINGEFEGKLDTKGTLTIGEQAKVTADITGEDITVAGKVTGNIFASTRLSLIAPANIDGDIVAPALNISEGAVFNGKCQMSNAGGTTSTSSGRKGMTLDEVARYLEVDTSLVEEWATQKKMPAAKESNQWRFNKTDIDSWVAKEKVGQ